MTTAIEVVEETERAQVLLDPVRLRLIDHLRVPGSAAALARKLRLPRQRINYHLRELESRKLIELVEERSKGSVTERIYRRSGTAYVISPAALGRLGAAPEAIPDRFSSAYQIALASRIVRELAALQTGARSAGKRLPTLALDADVRFASVEVRHRFAEELTELVASLVRKYHDERSSAGRTFRVYLGVYPKPRKDL
jgi:DNA-binding transcriptional ArsR family regulator